MKKTIAALAVALAVPSLATATSTGTCTDTGVRITFSGFNNPGLHDVAWTVSRDGTLLATGATRGHGSWSVDVTNLTPGPVTITDRYVGGSYTTQATAVCPPEVPVVPPAAPEPTPVPTGPVVETPVVQTPVVTPPKPPVRKPLTCRELRLRGVGINTLRKRGCVKTSTIKVCPKDQRRSTVRVGGTIYVRCTPKPVDPPAVTG